MGSSDTQKNFKSTEKRENMNTCDSSKVLPSEPQAQDLQTGSQVRGAGPRQLPSQERLCLAIAYKK